MRRDRQTDKRHKCTYNREGQTASKKKKVEMGEIVSIQEKTDRTRHDK